MIESIHIFPSFEGEYILLYLQAQSTFISPFLTMYFDILQKLMQAKVQQSHDHGITLLQKNRYETEQNSIFMNYQIETILQKLQNFKSLSTYERNAFSKNIHSIKTVLSHHQQAFITVLNHLASENQITQLQLITFLKEMCEFGEDGKLPAIKIAEPLRILINLSHLEIKEQSCELLAQIAQQMSELQRQQIFNLCTQLQHSKQDDIKIISVYLYCKMLKFTSTQQAERYFETHLANLYTTGVLQLKKQIIHCLPIIGERVSEEFFRRKIVEDFLIVHVKQNSMGIRRSCAEVLPGLAEIKANHKQLLTNTLLKLSKDTHKVVRLTACKVIPQFIAKGQASVMSQQLLQLYISLPTHQINKQANRQNQIIEPVAYYFLAILNIVGAQQWPKMSILFSNLLFSRSEEVHLSIASSLHQIAKTIGPELSKQCLYAAFNHIFKNYSDDAKLACISHLPQFLSIFDAKTRENLIDVFIVLQKNPKKWRIRHMIACQLASISKLYESQNIFRYIFPITMKLCNDFICEVRSQAALHLYQVIHAMSKDPIYEDIAEEALKGFGLSYQYVQRETFARMVEDLHLLPDFQKKYFDIVLNLAKDPILLVRFTLALSLKSILQHFPQKQSFFQPITSILFSDDQINENCT